jgi:O-antigen ligase
VAAVCVVYLFVPGLPRAAVALVDKGSIASGSVLVLPGSSLQPYPSLEPGSDPPEAAQISAAERVATTQAAIRMFASRPILGVGPGNFGFRYSEFRSPGTAIPDQLLIANNIYAELLAESGILGLVTYLAGFGGLVVLALRARFRAVGFRARALGAGVASLAAIASAYLTGPSFTILYQWAIFGLVAAMVISQREGPDKA